MPHFRILLCLIPVIVTAACAPMSAERRHANYARLLEEKPAVTVLPPKAEANLVYAGGKAERQYNYEYFVEAEIQTALREILREKGYHIEILRRKDLKKDKLYKDTGRLRSRYDTRLKALYARGPLQKEEIAFNIDEDVSPRHEAVREKTDADLVLVFDYNEIIKTGGAKALAIGIDIAMIALTGNSSRMAESGGDAVTASAGIIDAHSGDILWTHTAGGVESAYGGMFNTKEDKEIAREKIRTLAQRLLEPLPSVPRGKTAAFLKKKAADKAAREEEAEDESDDEEEEEEEAETEAEAGAAEKETGPEAGF